MALRKEGDYHYGDSAADVWAYFVWWTRNSPEPVRHHRQAVCPCGCAAFFVQYDDDTQYLERGCAQCEASTIMFEHEWDEPKEKSNDAAPLECVCFGEVFEVVGVTAPFTGDTDSAKWFYLGLRCVECGCLGCYADWIPRYNDARAYLAML